MIFLNAPKHHLSSLTRLIADMIVTSPSTDRELIERLHLDRFKGVIDIYNGPLSLQEIDAELQVFLGARGVYTEDEYLAWLNAEGEVQRQGAYYNYQLSDQSEWTLRGEYEEKSAPGEFVHIHPARHSPNTFRLKATIFRTVTLALFHKHTAGLDETDVAQINRIRPHINLPPIKEISPTLAQALAVVDQSLQAQLVKEA